MEKKDINEDEKESSRNLPENKENEESKNEPELESKVDKSGVKSGKWSREEHKELIKGNTFIIAKHFLSTGKTGI